jgi:hypothetical protein
MSISADQLIRGLFNICEDAGLDLRVGAQVEYWRKSNNKWYQARIADIQSSQFPVSIIVEILRRGHTYARKIKFDERYANALVMKAGDREFFYKLGIAPIETFVKLFRLGKEVEFKLAGNWMKAVVCDVASAEQAAKLEIPKKKFLSEIAVTLQYVDANDQTMKEVKMNRFGIFKFGTHLIPEDETELKEDDDDLDAAMGDLRLSGNANGAELMAGEADEDARFRKADDSQNDLPPEYQPVDKEEMGEEDEFDGNQNELEVVYRLGDVVEVHRPSGSWIAASINTLGRRHMVIEFIEGNKIERRKVPVGTPHICPLGNHIKSIELGEKQRSRLEIQIGDRVEILRPTGIWCDGLVARLGKRNCLIEFYENNVVHRRKLALDSISIAPIGTHVDIDDIPDDADKPQKDFHVGENVRMQSLRGDWIEAVVKRKGRRTMILEYMDGNQRVFKKVSLSSRYVQSIAESPKQ